MIHYIVQTFMTLVNLSITATWLVFAVLILRFLLRGAPKWIHVALWALVAIRLMPLLSVPSSWSAFNLIYTHNNTHNTHKIIYCPKPSVSPKLEAKNPQLAAEAAVY